MCKNKLSVIQERTETVMRRFYATYSLIVWAQPALNQQSDSKIDTSVMTESWFKTDSSWDPRKLRLSLSSLEV